MNSVFLDRWLGEEYRAASSRPASGAAAGAAGTSRPASAGSAGSNGRSSGSRRRGRGRGARTPTPAPKPNPGDLLRFEFDGDAVDGETATAESLDLEGDEIIDVHVLR